MHGGGDSGRQTTRVLDHPKENVMVRKNRRSTVEVTLIDMERVISDGGQCAKFEFPMRVA